MKIKRFVAIAVVFVAGIVVGVAASGPRSTPALYQGKGGEEAARALLDVALGQAGNGSWENLAVARTYYLMGDRDRGQQIIDAVIARKVKSNDWIRIGKIYVEANEWDKAQDAFDKVLSLDPRDNDYLAEIGAQYNLHGDRAKAEELFARSFAEKDNDPYNTANIAGSYVGVQPQD